VALGAPALPYAGGIKPGVARPGDGGRRRRMTSGVKNIVGHAMHHALSTFNLSLRSRHSAAAASELTRGMAV